ncbi:MauE/DoxX family redox-associated membrane protein [Aequorivita capsosiphonis]|uniref:MauE/DoxX family redox-associated membrane protein n=1 Tax=Aequorivita capsosiphonis TaxID=487317 RepID=UPI0003FC8313|nr:MauE/DoxX family redox-associated membrane protein [Aequorivita capsosiphonis]
MIRTKVSELITIKIITFLYMLLFVYAASSKLLDSETFVLQLAQSPLLSAYAVIFAWLVPGIELLIALLLIIPRCRTMALYGSFLLMVMFTSYIFIILNFSDFIPCSCGGVLENLSWSQHLIFNIVFIILAAIAILLDRTKVIKRTFFLLPSLTIIGIATVGVLFLFSEEKMHRNNAFQRRYIPHILEKIGEYDLKANSYYIAGINKSTIYLGNYGAPLYLKSVDTNLNHIIDFTVSISNTNLPYRSVKISVKPPFFYLGDGTVPILFQGDIKNWNAIPISYKEAYFTQYNVADSLKIGFITTSSNTGSNALGLFNKQYEKEALKLDTMTLSEGTNGKFETDGKLLWNADHEKFIYLYFYSNRYKIFDKMLNYKNTGKTIDTIGTPILDVAHFTKSDEFRLGGKSVMVNRQSSTNGDYLLIHSDRLGNYENDKILKTSSIIDVYNITNHSYAFSFYLFHQRDKKLTEFQVHKNLLIAIVEDKLWLYRLKPAYFSTGHNPTHTAQYQD